MADLAGKAAIVSGAGGSIGTAIGRLFAAQGASVVLADLVESDLAPALAAIEADGGVAVGMRCDVTDEASTRNAAAAAVERFGSVDVLVNCAVGELPRAPAVDVDPDEWRRIIEINLTGSYLVARAVIPLMVAQGDGVVILLASQFGRVGSAGQAAYCASKGGVIQLARTLALEHAADNVRVNTLSPGAVASERLRRHYGSDAGAEAALAPRHPLGRLARAEEVAHAALFLAAGNCAFMTGADLLVDGGFTAQ